MAIDLSVVQPQDIIRLSSVKFVPNLFPNTLDIIGEDFRSVDEVRINDVASPSVVILSTNRLLAQVPSALLTTPLSSVTVLSSQLTFTDRSLLRFRLGRRSTKVNGLLRLCQFFVKMLFTTPGRDIFSPNLGGGGLRNIGRSFSRQEGSGIVADFVVAVDTTARQVIALQARNPRLPREERLLSAKVVAASFNAQEAALIASVELLNQTGKPVLANLMM
jgi:hypothetical protein